MSRIAEAQAIPDVSRKREALGVAGNFRNHRTLCVGLLYVAAIIGVLAFVARL